MRALWILAICSVVPFVPVQGQSVQYRSSAGAEFRSQPDTGAVATLVRRNGVQAGVAERRQTIAPRVARLGEPVQQQDHGSVRRSSFACREATLARDQLDRGDIGMHRSRVATNPFVSRMQWRLDRTCRG